MRDALEKYKNSEFWQGVRWIDMVYEAMGIRIDQSKVKEFFRQIAAGEATIRETPEEFVKKFDIGVPMTEEFRKIVMSHHQGESRRELEAEDRDYARQFLRVFSPADLD